CMALERGVGQIAGEITTDPVPLRDAAQHVRLWEPAHAHGPFHRLPVTAEGEPAIMLACDRNAAEVDLRRPGAVDLDLALAHGAPLFQRRQIHIRKTHGPLDLPRLVAGEEYERPVG